MTQPEDSHSTCEPDAVIKEVIEFGESWALYQSTGMCNHRRRYEASHKRLREFAARLRDQEERRG